MIELKDFTESDFETLKSWIKSEKELFQFSGKIFTFPLTNKQLADYIKRPDNRPLKVILTETNQTIGHCALNFENGNTRLSRILIGDKELRGKKIGEQIVSEMTKLLFEDTNVKEVDLKVFGSNKGAIRCYEKAGFSIKERSEVNINGEIWENLNMILNRTEWEKRR
jgi:RimJ/RimL family protein N-acetyltransferase